MIVSPWALGFGALHGARLAPPWALGFGTLHGARLTAVVTGIAIAALALWTLLTDKDYSAWWRDRTAQ